MAKPLISIIVPIYKVEKYLEHCVESILNQTYDNFELILVDDGSPDNCPQMCDELAKTDEKIKVIHKTNGGLSDARNAGIEIAQGEYLAFVDSDDYIAPDMYEKLYNNLIEANADVSMCLACNTYDDDMTYHKCQAGDVSVFDGDEIHKALFRDKKLNNFAWNKLYKRELFADIRYPYGKIYEDLFTTYRVFGLCNRVVLDTSKLYYYRIRKDSIMGKARSVINIHKFEAFSEIEKFYEDSPELLMYAQNYMYDDLMSDVFKTISSGATKENKLFYTKLKEFMKGRKTSKTRAEFVLALAIKCLWVLKLRYNVQRFIGGVK